MTNLYSWIGKDADIGKWQDFRFWSCRDFINPCEATFLFEYKTNDPDDVGAPYLARGSGPPIFDRVMLLLDDMHRADVYNYTLHGEIIKQDDNFTTMKVLAVNIFPVLIEFNVNIARKFELKFEQSIARVKSVTICDQPRLDPIDYKDKYEDMRDEWAIKFY